MDMSDEPSRTDNFAEKLKRQMLTANEKMKNHVSHIAGKARSTAGTAYEGFNTGMTVLGISSTGKSRKNSEISDDDYDSIEEPSIVPEKHGLYTMIHLATDKLMMTIQPLKETLVPYFSLGINSKEESKRDDGLPKSVVKVREISRKIIEHHAFENFILAFILLSRYLLKLYICDLFFLLTHFYSFINCAAYLLLFLTITM